jgi:REP element-mobilizing transposase RayT
MTRKLRIEYPGAIYHITSMGNEKKEIFRDDTDRNLFLRTLGEHIYKHNWICHAYCLMCNHYHVLIETVDANLSHGMRDLNGVYSQRFNRRHDRVGHLLQGRYDARLIERDQYLLQVVRYIVLNPYRANLIRSVDEWRWSNYRATAGIDPAPQWLQTNWTLSQFAKEKKQAQALYAQFVMDGIGQRSPYAEMNSRNILGSDQFIHEVWESFGTIDDVKEYPRADRVIGRPTLDDIFQDCQSKKERDDAIVFAQIRCGYLSTEIARHLHLGSSTIGKIVKKSK